MHAVAERFIHSTHDNSILQVPPNLPVIPLALLADRTRRNRIVSVATEPHNVYRLPCLQALDPQQQGQCNNSNYHV